MKPLPLKLQFKQETGIHWDQSHIYDIHREKGRWIVDIPDDEAMAMGGEITNYDYLDYIKWLEEKLECIK